jgi:DNA polymerase-4
LGVQASSLDRAEPQLDLLHSGESQKWQRALSAADRLRDKYGETVVGLASALKSNFRERTHENPASLPGKTTKPLTE